MELVIFLGLIGFFVIRYALRKEKEENARRAQEENARRVQEENDRVRENARRAREEAERLGNERRRVAEQLAYERQILSACNESIVAFENIPKHLMTAEELLTTAESEFKDGVFSPFWDSIEKATRKLGEVDGNINLIVDRSKQYRTLAGSYHGKIPPFPVDPTSAQRLGTANNTAVRLQKVVRGAQRNFQFATIYEQRKTNSILMAGFSNLGEAIYGVGERLQGSIETLGGQISELSSSMAAHNERVVDAIQDVSAAVGEVSSQVGEVSSTIRDADAKAQTAMADQATRQERANRMLDNIQRHRVPPRYADH
jgi:chromosome segregation ATPase